MHNDDKEMKGFNNDQTNEEVEWKAFAEEDVQWEEDKRRKKKRKKIIGRTVGLLVVLSLLVSGLQVWFDVFNLPALRFVEVSNRLSKDPTIEEHRKSIVKIEWDGVKGTGFNIQPNGLIVTNDHVVENANKVNVHFNTGVTYIGKVITRAPNLDLAIIDIEGNNLPSLPVDYDTDWVNRIGERITFIGNPLAFTQIANEGKIAGEVLLEDWEVPVMMIEAPVYKGNSGSPVIDQNGKVIGVIFATLRNPSIETKEIIGVAIPSQHIEEILQNISEAN